MSRILVTGAAGFIGSHIAHDLSSEGHEILGLDNFNEYYSSNLKHLRSSKLLSNLAIQKIDLKNLEELRFAIHSFKPDAVIHLAAQPGVRIALDSWDRYSGDNLLAFSNVLQVALECRVKDFLYASSSSVYGNTLGKSSESLVDIKPQSFYGATKRANEILAASTGSSTRIRGLRFFSVYGEYGRPDMAYFQLAAAILLDRTFTKFGEGSAKRDFTHVSDVSRLTRSLLVELSEKQEGFSDVVNIGGGNPHTLNELIAELEVNLGKKCEIEVVASNNLDVAETHADTSYLHSLVEEKHEVGFSEGVTRFTNWISKIETAELKKWVAKP
jgi:UDP-glucuronate 4-epimerase